jgi:hypothetical protein
MEQHNVIPSASIILAQQAQELTARLRALMAQSGVTRRYEDAGGGYFAIATARPFKWTTLPTSARPLQNQLRRSYQQFADLVNALLADQPTSIREGVASAHERFLRVIDQDDSTTHETVEANEDEALGILRRAVQLVSERSSGDPHEALLVPDTNAFYAATALEHWTFAECDRFAIMLVPAIVSEIDRHKNRRASEPGDRGEGQHVGSPNQGVSPSRSAGGRRADPER